MVLVSLKIYIFGQVNNLAMANKMARMPIFGYTFFDHNSAISVSLPYKQRTYIIYDNDVTLSLT